jgi:hypothetical protein
MKYAVQPGYDQALEACVWDTIGFWQIFQLAMKHPDSGSLFQGLIAPAAMYVVESHNCLTKIVPELKESLPSNMLDLLRTCRHRAKLLNDSRRSLKQVSQEIIYIAQKHREEFLSPHRGLLAPVKKILQPDMGLYTYNGHIFWTTHATHYSVGDSIDSAADALEFGKVIGHYVATVLLALGLNELPQLENQQPSAILEMRDIKYEQIYGRSTLGSECLQVGAVLILVLAHVNFALHVIGNLLSNVSHTQFRLKFIAAFHAACGLQMIQDGFFVNELSNSNKNTILAELVP